MFLLLFLVVSYYCYIFASMQNTLLFVFACYDDTSSSLLLLVVLDILILFVLNIMLQIMI